MSQSTSTTGKLNKQETTLPTGTKPPAPSGDIIQEITGAFGKYQFILCFVLFLAKFFIVWHQMAILFLAPKISYTCGTSDVIGQCPCPDPVYDASIFERTIIMEWDLICERKWMTSFTQMLFQFGVLLGSLAFGTAADRFGRKNPLLVAVVLQLSGGVMAAYVKNFWVFTILRLFVGMSVGGTMVTTYVIVLEFMGAKYREIGSALYQLPFNVGHMMMPVIAYFLRDFSQYQLAISAPGVILLSYFWLVPESPRWLIAVHRNDEAITILEHVAIVNKRPTNNIRSVVETFQAGLSANQMKKGTVVDLFRTPNIRKNTICMSFNWLTCSYCFYGVSQYVGQLSGNVFFNVAASAGVTIVGTLLSIPLLKVLGRRTLVIVFNFICASCLIVLAFVPQGAASVVCACIGVVSSFIVFTLVYLYTSELFPTVVRNAAVGVCSMSARVGSMIAPFVIDLQGVAEWMPPIVFAILPAIAFGISFLLPETKGCMLMTTVEEGENFGKKT